MNAAAAVLLAAAAIIWLATPAFLVVTSCREARARRAEKARRGQGSREVSSEWLAVLAATEPSITAHPAATRIRDLIAANEAARIDDEWKAMNA